MLQNECLCSSRASSKTKRAPFSSTLRSPPNTRYSWIYICIIYTYYIINIYKFVCVCVCVCVCMCVCDIYIYILHIYILYIYIYIYIYMYVYIYTYIYDDFVCCSMFRVYNINFIFKHYIHNILFFSLRYSTWTLTRGVSCSHNEP